MSDLTPEEIAGQQFRTRRRGFDPDEVRSFLSDIGEVLRALFVERDRLRARLGDFADRDLEREFEAVGREVGAVLESARQAAEAMRERATAESARWRSEALAETEQKLRSAREDAERLRGDAWSAAEELLVQAMQEAERITREAEAEGMRLVGEGERESHRIQATAKREMEDLIRNARIEADRLTMAAQTDYDAIIAAARKESEAAQERTRALEHRRDELKRELESVRQSLSLADAEVEERREELGLAAPQEVERPEPETEQPEGWSVGETVRVVHPHGPVEEPADSDEPKALGFPGGTIPTGPEIRILSHAELQQRSESETPPLAEEGFPVFDRDLESPGPDRPTDEIVDEAADEAAGEVAGEVADQLADEDFDEVAVHPDPDWPDAAGFDDDPFDNNAVLVDPGTEPDRDDAPDPAAVAPEPAAVAPEPVPAFEVVVEEQSPPAPETAVVPPEGEQAAPGQQELFSEFEGLFARLRHPSEEGADSSEPVDGPAQPVPEAATEVPIEHGFERADDLVPSQDPFELRERLLLPVTNRALRNLKRQLTDEQNVTLEELRLDEAGWVPSATSIRGRVRADLVVLLAESFGAGHNAAEALVEQRTPRPPTPRHEVADEFSEALAGELEHVLTEGRAAGQGARQLGALVSRVFRAWRTDESERRIRNLSFASYHDGLLQSLELAGRHDSRFVVAGRGCATCRAALEADTAAVPPLHPGCGCTVIPG